VAIYRYNCHLLWYLHVFVDNCTLKAKMKTLLVPIFLPLLLLLEASVPVMSMMGSAQVFNYRKLRSTKNGPERCVLDKANKTTSSSSLKDCSFDCGRDGTCTGSYLSSAAAATGSECSCNVNDGLSSSL